MADEAENPVAVPEAAPAPETVPAVETAPVETPAPPEAAPAETPAVEEAPASEPTLLEQTKAPGAEDAPADNISKDGEPAKDASEKPADAKPEEAKPEEAAKPEGEQPAPVEAAKVEPLEYKYELPESLKLEDADKTELHETLDKFRADPSNLQPLVDYHAKRMEAYADFLSKEQWRVFNDTRKEWRNAVLADPEIGGAGHNTAMQAIARVRDNFVSGARPGSEEYNADLAAFDGFLRATGAGDHPVMLKFMHRIASVLDEPRMITPEIKPAPQPKSAKTLYDHPRSNTNGRAQ